MVDFDLAILEFMRDYPMTVLHVRTTGEYDPAQGKIVGVVKNSPAQAILLDYTLQSNGLGAKLGTEIKSGDKQLFMRPPHKTTEGIPVLVIDPTTDVIKVGTVLYNIVICKEINPTGTDPLVYELQLRR